MNARKVALKIYPAAASLAAGALVYLWLTGNTRKRG